MARGVVVADWRACSRAAWIRPIAVPTGGFLGEVRAERPATGRPDRLLRAHLNCPDIDSFVERFAGNITREGMFFPSREPRPAGSVIRFELLLLDGAIAFSGEGTVVSVKRLDPGQPHSSGMTVQFTAMAAASTLVLERLVKRRESQSRRRAARGAARSRSQDAADSGSSGAAEPGSPVDADPASPLAAMPGGSDAATTASAHTASPAPSMAAEPSPPMAEPRINVGGAIVESEPMPPAAPRGMGRRPRRDRGVRTSGVSWHGRRLPRWRRRWDTSWRAARLTGQIRADTDRGSSQAGAERAAGRSAGGAGSIGCGAEPTGCGVELTGCGVEPKGYGAATGASRASS